MNKKLDLKTTKLKLLARYTFPLHFISFILINSAGFCITIVFSLDISWISVITAIWLPVLLWHFIGPFVEMTGPPFSLSIFFQGIVHFWVIIGKLLLGKKFKEHIRKNVKVD